MVLDLLRLGVSFPASAARRRSAPWYFGAQSRGISMRWRLFEDVVRRDLARLARIVLERDYADG